MTGARGPIVTLDGPAGSGKSSTAKAVAERLGFLHLDSGALYRALTLGLLRGGVSGEGWSTITRDELDGLDVDIDPRDGGFIVRVGGEIVDEELRSAEVTEKVARLATIPAVRASLLELQRAAGARGRLVADGRDMGTVVFPNADVKVFLVADVAERARRRLLEEGAPADDSAVLSRQIEAMVARDRSDSERQASPLVKADDAHELDTTRLDFEDQVDAVVALVHRLTIR